MSSDAAIHHAYELGLVEARSLHLCRGTGGKRHLSDVSRSEAVAIHMTCFAPFANETVLLCLCTCYDVEPESEEREHGIRLFQYGQD